MNPTPFPVSRCVLLCLLVGGIYFIPQGLYFVRTRSPQILLEENRDETFLAVLASRAAGEHEGQPDPYRLQPGGDPAIAFYTAQRFPLVTLAAMARLCRVPVTMVLWAGSFVFPAVLASLLAYIAWLCGIRDFTQLSLLVGLSMLALPPPYWAGLSKYVLAVLEGRAPDFLMMLPYSRRYQPQLIGVFHFLSIALSLLLLRAKTGPARFLIAVASGAAFGISFYSYLYSWSVLLGWFGLGGACVWMWHRQITKPWLVASTMGIGISVPYWMWCLRHFSALGAASGLARTHRVSPSDLPELILALSIAVLLGFFLSRKRSGRELLWVPLVLVLSAALGVIQNVVTGVYIQPYHYVHYFVRPAMSFALVALLAFAMEGSSTFSRQASLIRATAWVMIGLALFSASVVQLHRYRIASTAVAHIFEALPAFEFLKRRGPAGVAVYSPQPEVHEAIPLYTNAVPYFSMFMWMSETAVNRDALLERIASKYVLDGTKEEDFGRLVGSRPWDIFLLQRQRTVHPQAELEMREMERIVLDHFRRILNTERPAVFAGLRYLMLPAARSLESTRFPRYFLIRRMWSDGRYTVFELSRDGNSWNAAGRL